jgi:hypothetical protein
VQRGATGDRQEQRERRPQASAWHRGGPAVLRRARADDPLWLELGRALLLL